MDVHPSRRLDLLGTQPVRLIIARYAASVKISRETAARRARREGAPARLAGKGARRSPRQLTSEFLAAAVAGDLAGLERILADDVVSFSDGGGQVPAALHPVHGRAKVARLLAARAVTRHPLPVPRCQCRAASAKG